MKKTKIYNSPITGLILSLLVNILFIFVLVNIGDFVSVSKKGFIILLSVISLLALLVNGLFVVGFAYKNSFVRRTFVIFSTVIILVFGFSVYYTSRLNKGLGNIIDKELEEVIDYSFVTIDPGQSTANLTGDNTIGFVEGDTEFNSSVEKEITLFSSTVQVVKYENYDQLFESMLDFEELDVAILPKKYQILLQDLPEEAQEMMDDSRVIHDFNIKVQTEARDVAKVLEEPFTILMMGLNDNLADSIILATVNPQTLNVTMTSIGRDSYIPIACYPNQASDKLNHARGRSRQCIIDTIENFLDVDIDFYFETDFYALVKVVDVLGGVEIESPITFGGSLPKENEPGFHEITIREGKYVMNGNEVITFARERYHFGNGDFQRQLNQQYVIKQVAGKMFEESKKNIDTPIKVLEAAEDNISMNLSVKNEISPLLGYAINNIAASPVGAIETFNIHSTQIQAAIGNVGRMSVILPYENSVRDIKAMIKENLSTEIKAPAKESFSFSMNHPFKWSDGIEGKTYYGGATISSSVPVEEETSEEDYVNVPSFNGMTQSEILSWGQRNGIKINVTIVDYEPQYEAGQVIFQSSEGEVIKPELINVTIVGEAQSETGPEEGGGSNGSGEPGDGSDNGGDTGDGDIDEGGTDEGGTGEDGTDDSDSDALE